MKELRILKFGGSLIDLKGTNIPTIIEQIKVQRKPDNIGPIAVFSAPTGYTNQLIHIGQKRARGRPASVLQLFRGYQTLMKKFVHPNFFDVVTSELDHFQQELELTLSQLKKRFEGHQKALVLTYGGELPTAVLFDYILQSNGLDTIHISKADYPVITTDTFEQAVPLINESKKRISSTIRQLEEGKVITQAGFLGMTHDGLETILGRGGSDLTALVDAILLKKKYKVSVILYKQHPIKSADPKIVSGQLLNDIPQMTFNEASKASVMGMKIVQNTAVRLAQQYNQPITIAPIDNPDQTTIITQTDKTTTVVVKCVTGIPNGAIVTLSNEKARTLEDTLRHWENYEEFRDLGNETLPSGKVIRDYLFYDASFLYSKQKQLNQLDPDIQIQDHVGIVTLIGDRMRSHPGVASTAISAIPHINIKRAVFLPHSSQIILVVEEQDVAEALRAIHGAVQQLNP